MLNFETYVCRYGETGIQAIIERIERTENVYVHVGATLEERWNHLMQNETVDRLLAA